MIDDLLLQSDIAAIVRAEHGDPFAILGPHHVPGGLAVRAFIPDAIAVELVSPSTGQVLARLERVHPDGFWNGALRPPQPYLLRVNSDGTIWETEDTYGFPLLLGDLDIYLIAEGRHYDLGSCLGAHEMTIDGVSGVRFAVWAPNARRVSVVGEFNNWDGRRHPMRKRVGPGVWEIFIPRLARGNLYKFEILGAHGILPWKADPVAWQSESAPGTASIVADPRPFMWHDKEWLASRAARQSADAPISIYEVHAGSWHGPNGANWQHLIEYLIPYAQKLGFTHIELMPVMTHPFGGSWGYQPLGQFSPQANWGSPADFAHFIDRAHRAGLGVILDWVPAHFPTDTHGLVQFDGTALYEHADPREGYHPDWNTLITNLSRLEVKNFLIASALFWIERYHADGLRVDAVASMLYRDYSRKEGEWVPNQYGGRENLEAIDFLRDLSRVVRERAPGAVLIAEESTSWPGVSRPAEEGGLGFHYKWNMGWMNDTLSYMSKRPEWRPFHHHDMSFGLIYAFSEHFVLPLSHDEVVHGKGSLLARMPGDEWQRFANLRAYFGFMWAHPGKKLLFMGGEFGQSAEWDHHWGPEWWLLEFAPHQGVQRLIGDLNRVYRAEPALHRSDCAHWGFHWVVLDDSAQSVFVFLRKSHPGDPVLLVACNFTPVPREGYIVGVPEAGEWEEILNTDAAIYGGSNIGNVGMVIASDAPSHGQPASMAITLPPLSTVVFKRK
jgi:1,4-alpha-glucan branching enzyme